MELTEVKSRLNTLVSLKGTKYILRGCTIRRKEDTNELYYQAELEDIKARSILITRIEDVET